MRISQEGRVDGGGKAEEARLRGIRIHEEFQKYVEGTTDDLDVNLHKIKRFVDPLRERYREGDAWCEMPLHFDSEWKLVETGDWANTWTSMVLDFFAIDDGGRTAHVVDLKTGKKYGNEVKHKLQLQYYAVGVMQLYPDLFAVTGRCLYADQPNEKPLEATFTRQQLPMMLAQWNDRGNGILKETLFKPNPTVATCRYCPYGSMHGNSQCSYAAYTDATHKESNPRKSRR